MRMSAALVVAASVLALAAVTGARAQAVPEGVERLLWCAAAFAFVAEEVSTVGEPEQAAFYGELSDALLSEGVVRLAAAGYSETEVMTLRRETSAAVDTQFGGELEPQFSVEDCEAALD